MSEDRFNFVVKNYLSDSSSYLRKMNGRILAVWGNNDLNVNAQLNACRYRAILNTHHQADIVVFLMLVMDYSVCQNLITN